MKKIFGIINILLAAAIFIGNYFYLTGSITKALCSGAFALLGLINLCYTAIYKKEYLKFSAAMSLGLILAMIGDVTIDTNFIIGAGLFALGHVFYFVAQSIFMKINRLDLLISGILFICAGAFVLFFPLLVFPDPIMQWVCLVYALIISLMTGKGISDFIRRRNAVTAILALGSVLFFFSDLMLVFDWFMNGGRPAALLCLGTYYPAQWLLAYSVYALSCSEHKKEN